jgi:hypothetical protein
MRTLISNNKDDLLKELKEAKAGKIWGEDGAEAYTSFVQQLIHTGSVEKAKIKGKFPT